MKPGEIRKKTEGELNSLLDDLFQEQFNLRMQRGAGQPTKPNRFKSVRRGIARIKTILHETARGE
ncbi:MAG: 50S ribosomal protein L29 [Methylococcales bacterium]